MPEALSKGSELITKLCHPDSKLSEFELKRCQKEAHDLLKVDASTGYMCLGIIASKQKDESAAVAYLENALANSPASFVILSNYGSILNTFGRFDEAAEKYEKASKIPSNAEVVGGGRVQIDAVLVRTLVSAGRLLKAEQTLNLHGLDFKEATDDFPVLGIVDFMKENAISDHELTPLFKALYIASKFCGASMFDFLIKIKPKQYASLPGKVYLEIKLDRSAEDVADVNMALIESLVSQSTEPRILDQVKFSFGVA